MKRIYFNITVGFLLVLSILVCAGINISCVRDDVRIEEAEFSDVVRIGAQISNNVLSRASGEGNYIESGQMDRGTLYLCYPPVGSSTNYYINDVRVEFGREIDPEIGFAIKTVDGVDKELLWSDIKGTKPVLYFHNLNPAGATFNTYRDIMTPPTDHPFNGGVFDDVNGSNDLLWGTVTVATNTKLVELNLSHLMSRFRVNLVVYPSGNNTLDMENAEVYITNLKKNFTKIELRTTIMTLPSISKENQPENTLVLYDGSNIGWGTEDESVEIEEPHKLFTTKDFVLPPQSLTTTNLRPRLVVKVPKGNNEYEEYSANLPMAMMVEDPNDPGNFFPSDFAFLQGQDMTLTATINAPNLELTFMPVKVREWVNKGAFQVQGDQTGIYSKTDFMNLITAYKNGNENQLRKYGYKNGDQWNFLFWNNVTLVKEDILGSMDRTSPGPDIPFTFSFNGYTITINKETGGSEKLSNSVGQVKLYNIVKGLNEDQDLPGISSKDDFMKIVELIKTSISYEDDNPANPAIPLSEDQLSELEIEFNKYGAYNNLTDKWDFEFTEDVYFDFDEIFQAFPMTDFISAGGDDINFVFGNYSVKVSGASDYITISENAFADALYKISAVQTIGINDASDFHLLTRFYNGFPEEKSQLLALYGTLSGTTWTFRFLNAMTLPGQYVFGTMIPDNNGKPSYSYAYSSPYNKSITTEYKQKTYSLTINSSTNAGYFKRFTSAGGYIASAANATTMISYYNAGNFIPLHLYGSFDEDTKTWTFNYGANISNAYSSFFGKMVPEINFERYDYNFNLKTYTQTITGVPTEEGTVDLKLKGEEGANTLNEIFKGTYNYAP
ncbi:MAG: hypothetical protein J1F67_11345 [Muribaculaceae bacterium]|nr:hypothetical protein [Muribaculaceae bacterium]